MGFRGMAHMGEQGWSLYGQNDNSLTDRATLWFRLREIIRVI